MKGSKHYEHQVKGNDNRKCPCKAGCKPLGGNGSRVDHRQAPHDTDQSGGRYLREPSKAAGAACPVLPRGYHRAAPERAGQRTRYKNAVQVVAAVKGKGSAVLGYLNKQLAAAVAPLMDKGAEIVSRFKAVTGGEERYLNYGLNIEIAV